MSVPATLPQQQQKQSETVSSAEEEALKRKTDCVYFLASPLTCKKGVECEYRHSEFVRMNPRDCYYWLNGNCMNLKCGFRHPPLEGLLGNQGRAPVGSLQPTYPTAPHPSVAKQPVPCVFFQKGMCMKGDMCSFLHTLNPAAHKKQNPMEANPAPDPQIFKKPTENNTSEKKFSDTNLSTVVKAHTDISAAPRVTSVGLKDRSVEGYVPKHVGYEPVVQRKGAGAPSFIEGGQSSQVLQRYGSDDNNSFHNGKDADDVLRKSSPGFDVLVDNETGASDYYHGADQYGRRNQEGGNSEYDPDFSAIADDDEKAYSDQRFDSYDQREDRYAWGHHRVSSERGDRLDRRVYAEDERSENILESDLRHRLPKQRKVNGMRSVENHDYAATDSLVERGYRNSRRDTTREISVSGSRLQGRIKICGRGNGDDRYFERRIERGRDRSELSSQGRLRDRIKGRLEENRSGDQERGFQAPWVRRREIENERKSAPRVRREESKPEASFNMEVEHHSHKRSRDSFAAPLPLSEILKRKRAAAASGGGSKKEERKMISKEETGDEKKLITDVDVSEPNPSKEAEVEKEGTIMEEEDEVVGEEVYEENEEEQGYEGDEVNGEYYYEEEEEGYEEEGEGGEYAYEEEVYAAEEGEEEATEAEGEEDKTVEMIP